MSNNPSTNEYTSRLNDLSRWSDLELNSLNSNPAEIAIREDAIRAKEARITARRELVAEIRGKLGPDNCLALDALLELYPEE